MVGARGLLAGKANASDSIALIAGSSLNVRVTGNTADRAIKSIAAGSPLSRAISFSVVTSPRPFRLAQATSAEMSSAP